MADAHDQVAEVFVVNNRNDPGFAAFALLNRHALARHIEITDIELDAFATTNAQPPPRFDQTAIAKIGCRQESFAQISWPDVIGRSSELVLGCRHLQLSCEIAHPRSGVQKIAPCLPQEVTL